MVTEKKSEFKRQVEIREIKTEMPNRLLSEFKQFQSSDQGSLFLVGIEGKDGVSEKLSTQIICDAYWNSGVHILVMISWPDSNHKKFHENMNRLSELTLDSFPELISK